ncbi:hypothetical protein CC205_13515 [Pseudomonas savastanoi pv. nerii]|uniref:Lipoprotein n=2 Tax=Pseudomonas savastanoi TaxID=29438 RepID=A0A267KCP6_PSESS|nr:hypothetical protein PSA3335_10095 [Pseudomonas savastanoi pv. savastanoi NCPPB 3335]PAB32809.1 hypothetical protein CC205_13515 [Pseudomonas savastanoi pv. nerii]RMN71257.1 hypothetical protein ALQ55_102977 [Pseudomonas savastanoi pv. savastanoi]RMT72354.1 hypothetical protein ALP42_103105 [Pseudomonas savastanoi pv. nerii]RMT86377.1 hypothetical protein ALP41_103341 [Pseudomonas savastanoi pv. nerii]
MKIERILVLGFTATIITMAACTYVIRKEIRYASYSASPDAVVRQLEEEGSKTRDLIRSTRSR